MPGIEIKGFEELRRNTEHICKNVLDRAIQAAEGAAAQVIRQAVESSAPRRSGQPARPWFETASASVESQAMEAGIAAFQAVVEQELGK
jgi:hypothetical protein